MAEDRRVTDVWAQRRFGANRTALTRETTYQAPKFFERQAVLLATGLFCNGRFSPQLPRVVDPSSR